MKDRIENAYRASRKVYDSVLTQGNIFSRLYNRIFWGGTDDSDIAEKMLSWIPEDFCGSLLDVPVGTAVFTADRWRKLDSARITCVDYSRDMICQAEERLGGRPHIKCVTGDIGNLPMEDGTFDIVFSMNGFHAFPDKEKAFREVLRVLKPGGEFLSCFYIRGKSAVTDWLVNTILAPKGWFTPPFRTEEELREILEEKTRVTDLHTDGSIVYFRCIK